MTFVSYASNFEDVLLNRMFRDVERGFYIDIGADHPVFASTTKSFYDRGWSGVNVEPGPNFERLKKRRPRDININAVVTDRDDEVDFFVNDDLVATSSVYEALHPNVAAKIHQRSKKRIKSYTLNSIVDEYIQKGEVHFLKIDTEGSEQSIILATDWSRFRPIIIVAESTEPFSTKRIDQQWTYFLTQNSYHEVYFDGINTWFVRDENREFRALFKVPVNILDDFVPFDYEKNDLRESIRELQTQIAKLESKQRTSAPVVALRRLARGLARVGSLLRR